MPKISRLELVVSDFFTSCPLRFSNGVSAPTITSSTFDILAYLGDLRLHKPSFWAIFFFPIINREYRGDDKLIQAGGGRGQGLLQGTRAP
jgi:hypothetical protein